MKMIKSKFREMLVRNQVMLRVKWRYLDDSGDTDFTARWSL